ncbi:Uncharacterised protein [uncultured archaeon]|nr:Uncharacterised protein [uncultured archaeon]
MVADYCTPITDLQSLFVAAVALSFAVISFLFMLGRMISKSEFEAMARKELRETLIAIVIAVAVVGLAGVSCEGLKAVMTDYAPGHTQFTYSYEYINLLIYEVGVPSLQSMWLLSYSMKNLKLEVTLPAGMNYNMFDALTTYSMVLERMAGLIFTPFIGSLHAQLLLLQFSQAFAITLILPIGMVLRAIPMARTGGSFLIALAFGLYVVLPLMYVVDYDISKRIWPGFDAYTAAPTPTDYSYSMFSEMYERAFSPIQSISKILPQATILAILNLTIFQSFVETFTKFINDIG